MKEEKKKWVMPKFLPHKYDVKLINEDKVCVLLALTVYSAFFCATTEDFFDSLAHNWSPKIPCVIHDLLRWTYDLHLKEFL